MKRRVIISVVIFSITILLLPISYAIYQNTVNVSVVTTTGDIICNLSVDTDETYIENNEAFFLITVDNFKTENDKTVITSTDIDYTLTIENTGNTVGLFRYVDEEGNTNTDAEETVTITKRMGKDKTSQQFKAFVTTDTNLKTDVDFKVKLNAHQADMS